jgi:hypothetical protein
MLYSSAVLFAALMVCGSMSPVFACRGEKNATIVKLPDDLSDSIVRAGPDQYNFKIDPGPTRGFNLVTASSHDVEFCVDLSVLDSSDIQNTQTGVAFWGGVNDRRNSYYLYIRNDQYQIIHALFDKTYELVPWTTGASIKKGLGQKNEVDVRVTATAADIQINGAAITSIVARPSADAQIYGVAFGTPKTGTGLFQVESPRIVK